MYQIYFIRYILFYLLLFVLSSCVVRSKSVNLSDTYFVKNKMYHYNTLSINEKDFGVNILSNELTIDHDYLEQLNQRIWG
jgi:hypothetical protein